MPSSQLYHAVSNVLRMLSNIKFVLIVIILAAAILTARSLIVRFDFDWDRAFLVNSCSNGILFDPSRKGRITLTFWCFRLDILVPIVG
ncbi:unnamed protein product [Schistosoma rodhaini]|uniref:Uncharacterized protein n=1 Tax=Schistosoma rodhaini TaxID=6188 RepID=A0AA85EXJ2_9TREM|nr:unnamed protein product [Schistosoma rodhaini]